MKIVEHEAKEMLERHGIVIPKSRLVLEDDRDLGVWDAEVTVKAQVLFGGRGKAGLVQFCQGSEVEALVDDVRDKLRSRGLPPVVMIEERQESLDEYYIAIQIDDISQQPVLLFSKTGGVFVEDNPDSISTFEMSASNNFYPHHIVPFFLSINVPAKLVGPLSRLSAQLFQLFCREDAELVEINPLCPISERSLMALDGKILVDDSAAYRHQEWASTLSSQLRHSELTELERIAADQGFTYVEMDGNIAVLTGGAGLGMLTLDSILATGHKPANFVDNIGGASVEKFQQQVEIVLDRARSDDVDAIVAFFTITATSLKTIVTAITSTLAKKPAPKPMIMGLLAAGAAEVDMTMEQALASLKQAGITPVLELAELMEALKEQVPLRDGG